nr:hypothetical protein [Ruminiclostridium cellobioparum]
MVKALLYASSNARLPLTPSRLLFKMILPSVGREIYSIGMSSSSAMLVSSWLPRIISGLMALILSSILLPSSEKTISIFSNFFKSFSFSCRGILFVMITDLMICPKPFSRNFASGAAM